MSIEAGVNMEFIRSQDKPFAAGVERAAKLGYKYVEPMVHNGRELLSEAGYFHSFSLDDDPGEMKDILDQNAVKASGSERALPADAAGNQRSLLAKSHSLRRRHRRARGQYR